MPEMNINQRNAVNFHDGALLLLAGPGSGKTFVITNRIKTLIENGVTPSDILVITFTKAAAIEMKDRFNKNISSNNSNVTFGTFHAIFYTILRTYKTYRNVVPITEKDKLNIVKRTLEILRIDSSSVDYDDLISTLSLVSACKNNGNNPELFVQDQYTTDEFIKVFNTYNSLLIEFNKIDFDDMINLCLDCLKKDESFRGKWQSRYKYILIDEFQDISTNQYELIKILAYPDNNIFVVGDDDQSIYRFRGANVDIMKRFIDDYKCIVNNLSINYRSDEAIVKIAESIILNNKNRFLKDIQANKSFVNPVMIKKINSDLEQLIFISKTINELRGKYIPYNQIAILFRTNRQVTKYSAILQARGIPCSVKINDKKFSSSYIQDILAYLELAECDKNRNSFLKIMNKPLRYIRRSDLKGDVVVKEDLLDIYKNDKYMTDRISKMFSDFDRMSKMNLYLKVHYIRKSMGYDKYLREQLTNDEYELYLKEIEDFMGYIKQFGSYREVKENLDILWKNNSNTQIQDGINIMTYHASKGLEFIAVILPDLNEGIVPPKAAKSDDDIEEERRMLYVAVTRAKEYLYITYTTDDNRHISRFIEQIKKNTYIVN